jgi:hypothetical protein
MHCVAAALCCLSVVAIAASDDPKELERRLTYAFSVLDEL